MLALVLTLALVADNPPDCVSGECQQPEAYAALVEVDQADDDNDAPSVQDSDSSDEDQDADEPDDEDSPPR